MATRRRGRLSVLGMAEEVSDHMVIKISQMMRWDPFWKVEG